MKIVKTIKDILSEHKSLKKFLGDKLSEKLLWWVIKRECRIKMRNGLKNFLEGCRESIIYFKRRQK